MHVIVRGLVQGVGYRWFAARRAESLGLRGCARNLFDGAVDVTVAGEETSLESFLRELRVGPRSAHVTGVSVEEIAPGTIAPGGFVIR